MIEPDWTLVDRLRSADPHGHRSTSSIEREALRAAVESEIYDLPPGPTKDILEAMLKLIPES